MFPCRILRNSRRKTHVVTKLSPKLALSALEAVFQFQSHDSNYVVGEIFYINLKCDKLIQSSVGHLVKCGRQS